MDEELEGGSVSRSYVDLSNGRSPKCTCIQRLLVPANDVPTAHLRVRSQPRLILAGSIEFLLSIEKKLPWRDRRVSVSGPRTKVWNDVGGSEARLHVHVAWKLRAIAWR